MYIIGPTFYTEYSVKRNASINKTLYHYKYLKKNYLLKI